MLQRIRKVIKVRRKKKSKSSGTPVPTTVAVLENQAVTDAHELAGLAVVKDYDDQEGSESTSSEYFSAAENLDHVNREERTVQGGEALSMSFFQGSSNVKNINPIFNQVYGDATFIRFGEAVFNDYQTKKKSGPCFDGTRVALLREIADWTGQDESRMLSSVY